MRNILTLYFKCKLPIVMLFHILSSHMLTVFPGLLIHDLSLDENVYFQVYILGHIIKHL